MLNCVYDTTKSCHISDFRATSFSSFIPLLSTKFLGRGGDADSRIFTRSFWYFTITKCKLWFLVFFFLLQSAFFFRNAEVKVCVQEKAGKEKDVIVKTYIGITQTFVTVARKLVTKSWKYSKIEW